MVKSSREAPLHAWIAIHGFPETREFLDDLVNEVGRLGLTPTKRDLQRFTPGCALDIWAMTYRCAFLVEAALFDQRWLASKVMWLPDLLSESFTALAESLKSTKTRTYVSIMKALGHRFQAISEVCLPPSLEGIDIASSAPPDADLAWAMHVIQAAAPSTMNFRPYEETQANAPKSEKQRRHRERRKLAARVLPLLEESVINSEGWESIVQATSHLIT